MLGPPVQFDSKEYAPSGEVEDCVKTQVGSPTPDFKWLFIIGTKSTKRHYFKKALHVFTFKIFFMYYVLKEKKWKADILHGEW